ncbi:putative ABC transport system permease protein [Okibacterium sp. HSC-33S16]|uniref:ABC transporter permease n=1 Tax=Okibacterium sp. HSC-33S16 TaxID=2910965 RepID=UPI00209D76C6|nr:ABC transporter permease [Okibacterium sp. HSC-33S16]MCP2031934.1 putative ABC transport system permease protein [Okibacterium sp. HSC-33S16]
MGGFLAGVVGACAEAWQEVRIHKGRVLLSLIGVAVAVCALSGAVAMSAIAQQATIEQADSAGGRAATLTMSMQPSDSTATGRQQATQAWFDVLDRYEISYASRVFWGSSRVQFPDSVQEAGMTVVDQPYGEMHRTRMVEGSWFQPGDSARLAPVVVINTPFWESLGSPDLATHPTVTIDGLGGAKAVIIGVYGTSSWDTWPSMFMLTGHFESLLDPVQAAGSMPQYEMWVPPDLARELQTRIQAELSGAVGAQGFVSVDRSDWGAQMDDPTTILRVITMVIGGIILLLGALSLVNIALVTVRQRIREIGIRRSFGATSGRVFFAVMMESVVATVVAGIVGVILAVLLVQSPMVSELVSFGGISDVPPFPASAAVFGLVVATVVGALAGLIPAIIAVRVKVIDAIRY